MSNRIQDGLKKTLASVTMVTTMLTVGGFAAIPARVLAVAPADYGLTEGDTISATGSSDPDIYIVNEHGYKRLFVNPAIFNLYGHLGWDKVKSVAPATRDAFGTSGLFRNCENGDQKVYGLEVVSEDVAVLHWVDVTGSEAVAEDPNFFLKVFCINNAEQALYGVGSTYDSVSDVPDYSRDSSGSPAPTGGLNGTVGSLSDATFVGNLSGEEVGEGESDVPVVGLDLEADNSSDIRILAVSVMFEHTGTGSSKDLDDYASEVSLWFDGSKVAEADVDDFSESNDEWSLSIALSGDAIIRMDETEELDVAVSALSNLDSSDLGKDWDVTIESVRFVDAQGAITTEDDEGDIGTETETFTFESFATAADVELEMKEASANPNASVHEVDDESGEDGIVMLVGTLNAQGSDITINELTFTASASGAVSNISTVADSFTLEIDGDEVQTKNSSDFDAGSLTTIASYTFDDVDYDLSEDDTVTFRLLADIAGTDDSAEGASLKVSIKNAETDADDAQGDALATGDLTGSVQGEYQTFYSEGVNVTLVSTSESATTGDSEPDLGTFVIKFKVSSFGSDIYIQEDCGAASTAGIDFGLDVGPAEDCSVTSSADDDGANGNFEVLDGTTEDFTLTVTASGTNAFERMFLEGIDWSATDVADPANLYNSNLDDFETDPLYLSST